MLIRQLSRRLVVITVLLLVLITALSGALLLPDYLAQRLIDRLVSETDIQISPVRVEFSLFSGELIAKDMDLKFGPGVQASADELRLRIKLTQLWDERLAIETLYLQSPYISINLDQMDASSLQDSPKSQHILSNSVQQLEFGKGGLYLQGSASEQGHPLAVGLAYSGMQINSDGESNLDITINGLPTKGEWQFKGVFDTEQYELSGELDFRELPLGKILNSLNIHSVQRWEQGLVSASQDVTWSPKRGIALEGSASIGHGELKFSGSSRVRWEELDLTGVTLTPDSYAIARAQFENADILLDESTFLKLGQLFPSVFSVGFSNSRLFSNPESWQLKKTATELTALNGQLSRTGEALVLQATALVSYSIPVSLESKIIPEEGTHLRANVRALALSELPEAARVIAGFDLSGTELYTALQLTWQEGKVKSKGQLTLAGTRIQVQKENPVIDLPLVKAAMTDNKGRMRFAVPEQTLDTKAGATDSIITQLQQAIAKSWEVVSREPYQYLGRLSGSKEVLQQPIDFVTGEAVLSPESGAIIKQWVHILNRRPGLQLGFQGLASRKGDRSPLAQHELEQDLIELYAAIHQKNSEKVSDIPADIRLQLIEQMYLRVNHLKLPEISEETREQRVQKAERWLLKNWPVKNEDFLHLAELRGEALRETLEEAGLAGNRLRLEPARVVDKQARSAFKLIYQNGSASE